MLINEELSSPFSSVGLSELDSITALRYPKNSFVKSLRRLATISLISDGEFLITSSSALCL